MTRRSHLWGSVAAFFVGLVVMIFGMVVGADWLGMIGLSSLPVAVVSAIVALLRTTANRHDAGAEPMYLIVDCETNGLPRDWRASVSRVSNWPRLVQIAWCAFDSEHCELESASHVIRPDGFEIRPDSTAIHGITQERAMAEGLPIHEVLGELQRIASAATSVIAHNASFDGSVIAAEYVRLRKMPPFLPKEMVCTMEASTDYCRLPGGPRGYKWPRLDELYSKLFDASVGGAHDAGVDARACADCFFELQKRGVIEME